jgi:GGDEF domain-containing protein
LLVDTLEEGASMLARRFTEEVFSNATMEVGEGEAFPVTVSLGTAGSDKIPHEDMLKIADERMYAAKEAYYREHERYR